MRAQKSYLAFHKLKMSVLNTLRKFKIDMLHLTISWLQYSNHNEHAQHSQYIKVSNLWF